MQRGQVIGSVVVVVSTDDARSRILDKFGSVNCSYVAVAGKKTNIIPYVHYAFKVQVILAVSDKVVHRHRSLYMPLHNSHAIV